MGALCFVVFVTVLKPNAISAVRGPSKPGYCNTESFAYARLPLSHLCRIVMG
jgi:hypothetical protein